MNIRYYMVCSRFEALIASQLDPEAFGLYMAVGTKKLASGHVIFFEVDPRLVRQAGPFDLDEIERLCVPHEDGSPKRSKYVSVYRVMEALPLPVYLSLYLTTPDGRVLRLDESAYDAAAEGSDGISLYQELCPLIPLVVSGLPPARFARLMTDPSNRISAPRLFFADMRLERDKAGRLAQHLPYPEPRHLLECVRELEKGSDKPTKTVSRTPRIHSFFRLVRRGFFLGDQAGLKFYRFPDEEALSIHHKEWWHSASQQ